MPWQNRLRTASLAILLAIATYFLFNPFVLVNALFNRAALFSNLGTSTAMYQVQGTAAGLRNALSLLLEGTGPLLAVAGVLSAIALASRTLFRSRQHRAPALAWLLFAPSALVLIQFFALAAGKPGEYGRFALVPDTVLLLAAFVAVDRFVRLARDRVALATILLASTAFFAFFSLRAFVRDASSTPARLQEARRLQQLYDQGARTLAITADPAPYNLPPVNLFAWHLLLLPPDPVLQTPESLPDVIIRPLDAPVPDAAAGPVYDQLPDILNRGHWHPRLPWADKPFQVLVKRGLQPPPFAQARPFTPSPTPPGY